MLEIKIQIRNANINNLILKMQNVNNKNWSHPLFNKCKNSNNKMSPLLFCFPFLPALVSPAHTVFWRKNMMMMMTHTLYQKIKSKFLLPIKYFLEIYLYKKRKLHFCDQVFNLVVMWCCTMVHRRGPIWLILVQISLHEPSPTPPA